MISKITPAMTAHKAGCLKIGKASPFWLTERLEAIPG
jgi:hypothetical protein